MARWIRAAATEESTLRQTEDHFILAYLCAYLFNSLADIVGMFQSLPQPQMSWTKRPMIALP